MRNRAFQPSVEVCEPRELKSGALSQSFFYGTALGIGGGAYGTPNYEYGGTGPVVLNGRPLGPNAWFGKVDGLGIVGDNQYEYTGWLQILHTNAEFLVGGVVGNGQMNYIGISGFVKGTSGTFYLAIPVGFQGEDSATFDGPHPFHSAPIHPIHPGRKL